MKAVAQATDLCSQLDRLRAKDIEVVTVVDGEQVYYAICKRIQSRLNTEAKHGIFYSTGGRAVLINKQGQF